MLEMRAFLENSAEGLKTRFSTRTDLKLLLMTKEYYRGWDVQIR
jgi:hypothetical protein